MPKAIKFSFYITFAILLLFTMAASAQQMGSIRGVLSDKEFSSPLAGVRIIIAETGEETTSTDEGNFVFNQLTPGVYTLIFSKEGYTRRAHADVVVSHGQMTDMDLSMAGEFTEMEEFVVKDMNIGGTEAGLMALRIKSPALLDSVSSEWMSQAGASDASSALKFVAGATVQDGKFAVIRGLPDRYVNSQMNSVRLPSADPDKRAVQLDQFPTEMIESMQISKTFTPDQQGDASGGAVNLVLKKIPDKTVLKFKIQGEHNTHVTDTNDFLTYDGGNLDFFGIDDERREIPTDGLFSGDVGASVKDGPRDYKSSFTIGGKHEAEDGITLGGIASAFYKHNSSYFNDGIDDALWIDEKDLNPGLTPQYGNPDGPPIPPIPAVGEDFKTKLFDVTEGTQEIQWGVLTAVGVETENHSANVMNMHNRATEDKTILAEDTRGKAYYFPGYNPDNPFDLGNAPDNVDAAPYLRSETLKYTERESDTWQFSGKHSVPTPEFGFDDIFTMLSPELKWTYADSFSKMDEPDERQFGSVWHAGSFVPGNPSFGIPPAINPPFFSPFKPAANILLGNVSRTWQKIAEDSNQIFFSFEFPFRQWSGDEGYVKLGYFNDDVKREFDQDSFGNFRLTDDEAIPGWEGAWGDSFSEIFPTLGGPTVKDGPPFVDVDYEGDQKIEAWYYMADLPLWSFLKFTGGFRYEKTELAIINDPEEDAKWVSRDAEGNSLFIDLNPGDADVFYDQDDILPSIGFTFAPLEMLSIRGSYTETIARPTFKELTPIQQQEFLGGDVFIGNPELIMSSLINYDVRVDLKPYKGGLISFSYFRKEIDDPIEYVQDMVNAFSYTTPRNFPEGEIKGVEIETRQRLGYFWDLLEGISIGGNATFMDSKVRISDTEKAILAEVGYDKTSRDMVSAPEHLYNLFLRYDRKSSGTNFGVFYTVKGDTLITGAGNRGGNFVPDVYAKEFNSLNLSVSQNIGEHFKLTFKAKNLTNPVIEEIYRGDGIGDTVKASHTKGMDFTLSLTATW